MAYKASARFLFSDPDFSFSDLQFSWPDFGLGNVQHELKLISSNASPTQVSSNFDPNQPIINFPPPPIFVPGLAQGDWYLQNVGQDLGTPGQDLDVVPVWQDYTGKGVHVGVFDSGVQFNHPDLQANIVDMQTPFGTIHSYSPTENELKSSGEGHGTSVAGIIAAHAAHPGLSAKGIAYDASITGVQAFNTSGVVANIGSVLAQYQYFDVVNNSWSWWGNAFFSNFNSGGMNAQVEQDIDTAAAHGRNGLGTVMVVASGNTRENGSTWNDYVRQYGEGLASDANSQNFVSDRHMITVGAVDHNGHVLDYSTPGASLVVSAFSGENTGNSDGSGERYGILTTDLMGTQGFNSHPTTDPVNGNYTLFNGTSAAAPEITGVVALMLQANPNLGWRDVKDILELTARHEGGAVGAGPIGAEKYAWVYNGADDWNGGGLHFSNDYGFGVVDPKAAVRLAETWTGQSTTANEASSYAVMNQTIAIPDAFQLGQGDEVVNPADVIPGEARFTMTVDNNLKIEDVTLTLRGTHPSIDDLVITLVSPDGTHSIVLDRVGGTVAHRGEPFPADGWTMTSREFAGELSAGTWTVIVDDMAAGNKGSITGASLVVYGDANIKDDTYVFTDEFGALGNDSSHTFVMFDRDGGIDTINAAAVSTASIIDLQGGQYSIAGRTTFGGWASSDDYHLHLIENVIGGDGGDTLGGNAADNHLQGMRGDDTLRGYAGNDTLDGGVGNDNLDGGTGNDILIGGAGADVITGGDGYDTASYSTSSAAVNVNLATGTGLEGDAEGDHLSGIEHLVGSSLGDQLIADSLGDMLDGNAGSDVLLGGAGNDTLNGGQDDDSLRGRAGNDTLDGGFGNDHLDGGAGDDTLTGGAGADVLIGGSGYDTASYWDSLAVNVNLATGIGLGGDAEGDRLSGIEHIDGSRLGDTLTADSLGDTLDGNAGDDLLTGGAGNDTLDGGRGDDILMVGQGGVDHIDGGVGIDTENFSASASAIWAQLDSADSSAGPRWTLPADPDATGHAWTTSDDSLWDANYSGHFQGIAETISVENITGSLFNDILEGDNGTNILIGGGGDDELYGMGGADIYIGGNSPHDDRGSGDNLVGYWYAASAVTVDLEDSSKNTGEAADDRFFGIDGLGGSSFDDALHGTRENNVLMGEAGADILDGREGEDTASYRWAVEGVTASLAHSELNTGDAKGDIYISIEDLQGSYFNDTLTGDTADNRIEGLNGQDTLTGGGGNDTFVFRHAGDIGGGATGSASDVITDFTTGDVIDLSGIDAIDGSAQKDGFSFIGNAAFSGHAGELRTGQDQATGISYVQGDTNGDGIADFQLDLSNQHHLAVSDFLLAVAANPAAIVQGKAEDGYLAGATIFADANGDHVLNAGEVSTTTDGQGNFKLPAGSAPLIAIGGTDIATGLAFTGILSAPSNATVITPLTTLVEILRESGIADPVATVLQVLRLPSDTDLLNTDPVARVAAGDASAFALLAAGAIVMSDVALLAAGLEGQSNMAPMTATATAFAAVASFIVSHPIIDPTNAGLLGQLAALAGLTGETATHVTAALVSINGEILAAPNTAALTAIQAHAQGDLTDAIADHLPTAGSDHVTAQEHTPLVLSAAALLANDSDPDGDTLHLVSVGHATHGDVVFDAIHQTVTFSPAAGYSGAASFTYTMSDGRGGVATGMVDVTVKAGTTGGGWGDVHYTSFDGFKYSLQSTGDYVITHATSGPEFEVEGRAESLGRAGVSYLTAVAVKAGDHQIVFDEARPGTMLIDGQAVAFAVGDRLDLGDGTVVGRATATTHQIETALDFVQISDAGNYLDLSVHAGSSRGPGSFEGLLGNFDGNAKNDFGLPNGTSLLKPSTHVIETQFADAWRVGNDTLLASLGNETFAQRLTEAAHDHAAAISVHDWHLV
jgi:Ca2+-binding RTX toxin-like protein